MKEKKESLFVIRDTETGNLVFSYATYQGNTKKCLFNRRSLAESAIKYLIHRSFEDDLPKERFIVEEIS